MARIRILDAWLRCPGATPIRQRAVMVVAEAWAEQRVLMRAYAGSPDQTRPTIMLYGHQLAISPAGLDAHGAWGIHVEPPVDGRAQSLRQQLEIAARRLSGSKGNPPRLADEESAFERRRTSHWAPGTPPDLPSPAPSPYYEPAAGGAPAGGPVPAAPAQPPAPAAQPAPMAHAPARAQPVRAPASAGAPRPGHWPARVPRASPSAPTVQLSAQPGPGRAGAHRGPSGTVSGLAAGAGAQFGRSAHAHGGQAVPHTPPRRLASLIKHTIPLGFQLTPQELAVLDALDRTPALTAAHVASIAEVTDGSQWMQALIAKLAGYGIDLIAPATGPDGTPVYALRR
ncbi:hypothetical protein [Haliangium sp.]|uniref:hypothetical protein n=1 Tax=Haliangium sp. TaxID=2663208 RepID=UPI003D14C8D9